MGVRRSQLRHAWLGAIASCLVLLAGAPAARASSAPPADWYAVNAQFLFPQMPQAQWGSHLDTMADIGVRVVRYDATWDWVEPQPGAAYWQHYDAVVGELAERRLRWLPVIDYSARWAASIPGDWRSPPARSSDYAAFARAVAARYGRGGSFWAAHPHLPPTPVTSYEVWNEPNWRAFWRPGPDAGAYANLYADAREAIRSADGGARVIVGGLVPDTAPAYVREMVSARPGLREAIDTVGLHPYHRDGSGVVGHVQAMRVTLDDLGMDATPIAVTEVGWPSQGADNPWLVVDHDTRASRLGDTIGRLGRSNCDVSLVAVHTWVTPEHDPEASEHWFGLYRPDGSATPAGRSFGATMNALAGGTAGPPIAACGDRTNHPPAPAAAASPPPQAAPSSDAPAGDPPRAAVGSSAPVTGPSHPQSSTPGKPSAAKRCKPRKAKKARKAKRARKAKKSRKAKKARKGSHTRKAKCRPASTRTRRTRSSHRPAQSRR